MRKILVTGGGGFIGSHICVALLKNQFEVVIIDSFVNSSRNIFRRVIEICQLDNISVNDKINISCF